MAIIWGNKIGLRPFEDPATEAEIEQVYHWSGDEQILRWSGGAPTELTLQEFRDRVRGEQKNPLEHRRAFFIVTRAGELIGRIGCFAIEWDKHAGELGVVIGEPSEWGKEYGREAVTLLLRYIFETTSLDRIYLYTYPDNLRAQRCFAACGFRNAGTARRFSPDLGEYDGVEMEITRREFLTYQNLHDHIQISISQDAKC